VAAYAGDLGPGFERGLFVCQDNNNNAPGSGNQDFKLVRWEALP
jgi:myo-inositol-hexaphosphate 3-phosphohydrolase